MTPVLFTLGWIDVPSFTALMALALGAGLWLTWDAARCANLLPGNVLDAALAGILVGVIAARALYVSDHWGYFRDHTDQMTQLWLGGLSWHGGLIGGAIGAAAFSLWRKLNVGRGIRCAYAGADGGRVARLDRMSPGRRCLRTARYSPATVGGFWRLTCPTSMVCRIRALPRS